MLFKSFTTFPYMESYFFIGVAGVGMSAIAQYLVGKGVSISGSDRQFGAAEKPLVMSQLEDCGVKCFPQDGSGVVEGLNAVVVSTASLEIFASISLRCITGIPSSLARLRSGLLIISE